MAATMGQPKPQASLSSGLLARKGQARPAMRPQGFSGFGNLAEAIDDLGWNDMDGAAPMPAVAEPPVLREREALKAEIEAPHVEPVASTEAVSVPAFAGATSRKKSTSAMLVRSAEIETPAPAPRLSELAVPGVSFPPPESYESARRAP